MSLLACSRAVWGRIAPVNQRTQSSLADYWRLSLPEAPTSHKQQIQHFGFVNRLPSAEPEGCLTLLGSARGELSRSLFRSDSIGILLIVEFDVGFCTLTELVTDQQTATPALGTA